MVDANSSPANHYETLLVAPTATDEEISRAFESPIRALPSRAEDRLVHLARVRAAYGVLRDPSKREAHDASLGIRRPGHDPLESEPFADLTFATFILESLSESVRDDDPRGRSRASNAPSRREPLGQPYSIFGGGRRVTGPRGRLTTQRRAFLAVGVVGIAALGTFIAVQPDATRTGGPAATSITVALPPAIPAGGTSIRASAATDVSLGPPVKDIARSAPKATHASSSDAPS
jgi:curved DNA-binding protein CbpA